MNCPLCGNVSAVVGPDASGQDATLVNCPHCGKFGLSGTLAATLSNFLLARDAAPKLSHVVRKAHEAEQQLLLNSYTAEAILLNPLPRPREQADLLVQWLARHSPGPGEPVELNHDLQGAAVGSKSHAGFSMLIEHLKNAGLVTGPLETYLSGESVAHVALTFSGWDYYESLRSGNATYRKAVCARQTPP